MTKTHTFLIACVTMLGISAAFAKPTCNMQVSGQKVTVTIADTGLVYRTSLGQTPPKGVPVYQGTGRTDDRTLSCKDADSVCKSASWYLRFPDAMQGWPGDETLASDSRAVKCAYDSAKLAQVCGFEMNDGMKTAKGQVLMHFSAQLDNQTPAAYQPQVGGCKVVNDAEGNPHTLVSGKQP